MELVELLEEVKELREEIEKQAARWFIDSDIITTNLMNLLGDLDQFGIDAYDFMDDFANREQLEDLFWNQSTFEIANAFKKVDDLDCDWYIYDGYGFLNNIKTSDIVIRLDDIVTMIENELEGGK